MLLAHPVELMLWGVQSRITSHDYSERRRHYKIRLSHFRTRENYLWLWRRHWILTPCDKRTTSWSEHWFVMDSLVSCFHVLSLEDYYIVSECNRIYSPAVCSIYTVNLQPNQEYTRNCFMISQLCVRRYGSSVHGSEVWFMEIKPKSKGSQILLA